MEVSVEHSYSLKGNMKYLWLILHWDHTEYSQKMNEKNLRYDSKGIIQQKHDTFAAHFPHNFKQKPNI